MRREKGGGRGDIPFEELAIITVCTYSTYLAPENWGGKNKIK